MIKLPASEDEGVVFRELAPLAKQLGIAAPLLNAKDDSHAWGVEYRVVTHNGRKYLSALDHLQVPQIVQLPGFNNTTARDLLSGNPVNPSHIELEPMKPALVDLGPVRPR